MKFFALTFALVTVCTSMPQGGLLPAGLTAADCPTGTYPFCGHQSPAALPSPVINGQNVAPVLNTLPAETFYHQSAQLDRSPANFPQPIIDGQAVAPVLNTVPAQTNAHEQNLLIHAENQLQQLKDQQLIQIRQQEQEIEAARHFGRL